MKYVSTRSIYVICIFLVALLTVTTCKVEMEFKVTDIMLNESEITLSRGNTRKLEASIVPSFATNQEVTWSTGNVSIVSVSDGNITAQGIGRATITVTTLDGNFRATCDVIVVE